MINNTLAIFLCLIGSYLQSQNPKLDSTFQDHSHFYHYAGIGFSTIYDDLILENNKILVAGKVEKVIRTRTAFEPNPYNTSTDFLIARFHPDGRLDSSFADFGIFHYYLNSRGGQVEKLHSDSKGRIYGIGKTSLQKVIFRLDSTGRLDKAFANQGIFTSATNWNAFTIRTSLVTPQSQLILAGNLNQTFFLSRLQENGEIDSTFGTNGGKQLFLGNANEPITDLGLQYDSLILAAGYSGDHGVLIRLLPNGDIDTSFANGGRLDILIPALSSKISHLHVFKNNSFVITGKSSNLYFIRAYLPDGQPDNIRYSAGLAVPVLNVNTPIQDFEIAESRMSFILSENADTVIVRKITSSGHLDRNFGFQGLLKFQLENLPTESTSLSIASDSALILAGHIKGITDGYIMLSKLDERGEFIPTFQHKGYQLLKVKGGAANIRQIQYLGSNRIFYRGEKLNYFDVYDKNDTDTWGEISKMSAQVLEIDSIPFDHYEIQDFRVLPDSSILITGSASNSFPSPTINRLLLVKTNSVGKIDTQFGQGGFASFTSDSLTPKVKQGKKIVIQPDNKILVAAEMFVNVNNSWYREVGVLRFHANGQLDTSFNHTGFNMQIIRGETVEDLILTQDNQILLCVNGPDYINTIYKFFPKGTLDQSFSFNGRLETFAFWRYRDNNHHEVPLIASRINGKLLVGGSGDGAHFLRQFTANGNIDSTFGTGGQQVSAHPDYELFAQSMGKNSFGEVLIAGWAEPHISNDNRLIAVSCFLPDGSLKSSFGQNGLFLFDPGSRNSYIFDIEIEPNDNFYLAGSTDGKGLIIHFLNDLTLSTFDEVYPNSLTSPLLYPNPISQTATLKFELSFPQEIEINLMDLSGRQLAPLVSGHRPQGQQNENLEIPAQIPAGLLIIQVITQEGNTFIKALKK